jgi:hypothetical protein
MGEAAKRWRPQALRSDLVQLESVGHSIKKRPPGGRAWINPDLAFRRGEEPQSHGSRGSSRTNRDGIAALRPPSWHCFLDRIQCISIPSTEKGSIGYHINLISA